VTIHGGRTAPVAAGVIHTDSSAGSSVRDGEYEDSWRTTVKGARKKGRAFGRKEYVVKYGDVMLFRSTCDGSHGVEEGRRS